MTTASLRDETRFEPIREPGIFVDNRLVRVFSHTACAKLTIGNELLDRRIDKLLIRRKARDVAAILQLIDIGIAQPIRGRLPTRPLGDNCQREFYKIIVQRE
jgi:hypothetical protein